MAGAADARNQVLPQEREEQGFFREPNRAEARQLCHSLFHRKSPAQEQLDWPAELRN
jgi:hypothetical protein